MRATDVRGHEFEWNEPPRRIVSLVPSLTETLFFLGLGERVVGVTDYCVHPAESVAGLPKLGGTKNPDLERLLALSPDFVIANKEENRRRDVERLDAAGLPVFVTYARSVASAAEEIRRLGELLGEAEPSGALADRIELQLVAARNIERERLTRVEALIWKDPFMVVGPDTFAHDLLVASGGHGSIRSGDRRYPRVSADELAEANPEVILLPTEPYAFAEPDRAELLRLDCDAARDGRIHIVEGELLTWYGPRIPEALRVFSKLLA